VKQIHVRRSSQNRLVQIARIRRCQAKAKRAYLAGRIDGAGARHHDWRNLAMLKGINPLLNADVLQALAAMGHGDDLVIVDTNFPADSVARQTRLGRLLRVDNTTSAEAAAAILSVYPLDTFVDDAAARMEVVGKPKEIPLVQKEVQKAIDKAEGKPWPMISIERYAFYERAKQAYCVIRTGERRFYGCFAFRKGVVPPDA
jgi:L-fucose mutarotase